MRKAASSRAYVEGIFSTNGVSRAERYSRLDPEKLRVLAAHLDACDRAMACGREKPKPPPGSSMTGLSACFLKSVKSICRKMPHTQARRDEARTQVHSMCHWFNKPTFFITFSPNDGCSICIRWLSGSGEIREMPLRHVRYAELSKYPGAAALAFERLLKLFVYELLGWDIDNRRAHKKGVFGWCRAFFGPIEEQGRLSLHLHLLLWIRNAENIERTLDTEEGRARLVAMIDNAISAGLNLPTAVKKEAQTCKHCGKVQNWEMVDDWEKFRRTAHHRKTDAISMKCAPNVAKAKSRARVSRVHWPVLGRNASLRATRWP